MEPVREKEPDGYVVPGLEPPGALGPLGALEGLLPGAEDGWLPRD